jgi:hypothetical protein
MQGKKAVKWRTSLVLEMPFAILTNACSSDAMPASNG